MIDPFPARIDERLLLALDVDGDDPAVVAGGKDSFPVARRGENRTFVRFHPCFAVSRNEYFALAGRERGACTDEMRGHDMRASVNRNQFFGQ